MAMALNRCARCGRDIAAGAFKFQDDDGLVVCEDCFHSSVAGRDAQGRNFSMLRAVSVLLKVVGFVGLIGGVVLAHVAFERSVSRAIEAGISGVFIFLVCIVLSELLRLGLSVEREVSRTAAIAQRMLDLMRERAGEKGAAGGETGGRKPW